jgi:hypothetical protein
MRLCSHWKSISNSCGGSTLCIGTQNGEVFAKSRISGQGWKGKGSFQSSWVVGLGPWFQWLVNSDLMQRQSRESKNLLSLLFTAVHAESPIGQNGQGDEAKQILHRQEIPKSGLFKILGRANRLPSSCLLDLHR